MSFYFSVSQAFCIDGTTWQKDEHLSNSINGQTEAKAVDAFNEL